MKRNYIKEAWGDQWEQHLRDKRAQGWFWFIGCLVVFFLYWLIATQPDLFTPADLR